MDDGRVSVSTAEFGKCSDVEERIISLVQWSAPWWQSAVFYQLYVPSFQDGI